MAHLIVRGAGGAAQRVDLGGDVFRIGCVLDNDLQLDDDAVSAHHAQLRCGELGYTLSALAGAGGLFVNDRPVQERLLRTGDEIRVGRTRLTFEYDESDAPPVPAGEERVPLQALATEGDAGTDRDALRFELLYRIGRKVLSATSLPEVVELALPLVFDCVEAERGALLLRDPASGELRPCVLRRRDGSRLAADELEVPRSIVEEAVSRRVGILTTDALRDRRFEARPSVLASGIRSALCAPLWAGDAVLGVVYLDSRLRSHVLTRADLVLASAVANLIAIRLRQDALYEELARERVERAGLERYHSPDVAEAILRGAKQRGEPLVGLEERDVTILFADVEGWTPLAEAVAPGLVAEFLNEYYELTTRVVFAHGGSVNEFVGDSVMAVFGAPVAHADHADRAVRAGLDILAELARGGEGLMARIAPRVRIAVNSGRAVVGSVGAPNRLKYAVIGDPVNVAARLERIGEPNRVTLGEETRRRLVSPWECEDLGPLELRGRARPVRAWRIRSAPEPRR